MFKRNAVCFLALALAVFLGAHSASAFANSASLPWQDQQGQGDPVADADTTLTPEEAIERRLEAARDNRQPLEYFQPRSVIAPATANADGESPSDAKPAIDLKKTWDAYEAHKNAIQAIYDDIVDRGVREQTSGADAARQLYDSGAADELIRLTIEILRVNGKDSPKAIKALINNGIDTGGGRLARVDPRHARMMWFARDLLVRRTIPALKTKLKGIPGLDSHRIDITVLDSGSFGSIGSDIDKTLHLTIWDGDGNEVKAFGPDGVIGSVQSFLDMATETFNELGPDELHLALDTEFFGTDTLPRRLASGATHGSAIAAMDAAMRARREGFDALQRNAGPSYQLAEKVISQVVGRAVEADVNMKAAMERVRQDRARFEQLDADQQVDLFFDEMMGTVHGSAVVYEDGAEGPRSIDVVEFLEMNNLETRYMTERAGANAFGDYEKLVHKQHAINRDGGFDLAYYDLVRNDIAKYGFRAPIDTATSRFTDDGFDKPFGMGDFNRRFVPANALERYGKEAPNGRPYTRDVHDQLYDQGLRKTYGDGPDAERYIARDLERYWLANQANADLLALKADPGLNGRLTDAEIYGPLIEHLREHASDSLTDFERLGTTDPNEAAIRAAKQLHLEASVDSSVLTAASHLERGLDMWLGDAQLTVDNLIASERNRADTIVNRRFELTAELRRTESAERREALEAEIATLNERRERALELANRMEADPTAALAEVRSAGVELGLRVVTLFGEGDPNYERMLSLLPPDHRQELGIMVRMYRGESTPEDRRILAERNRIDLASIDTPTPGAMSRLADEYAKAFGIDVDAYFSPPTGDYNPNRKDRVVVRFIKDNYLQIGNSESFLNLARAMQTSRNLPYEQRMNALADAVAGELIGPVPGLGNAYATYKAYESGNGKEMVGGAVGIAQELIEMWIGATQEGLEAAMVRAGQASRVATLNSLAQFSGYAVMYLTMAKTAVEIVGHEAFEPVRDQYFQVAYQGFIEPDAAGLLPTGLDPDNPLNVSPIIEPGGAPRIRFLHLRAAGAERYLNELRVAGETGAADALLTLGGINPDTGESFNASGVCDSSSPQHDPRACPVTIDLETDFNQLIADARAQSFTDLPTSVAIKAGEARDRVVNVWREMAELQAVTRGRILADREARRNDATDMNLWLLAARENLGWNLEDLFQRQYQLLYERLVESAAQMNDTEASRTLRTEADEAWEAWQDLAPGHEDAEAIGRRFIAIMSPLAAYNARVASIQQQAGQVGSVNWLNPTQAVGELASRRILEAYNWENDASRRRASQTAMYQRQLAALATFRDNKYMDSRLPTDPFVLQESMDWYTEQVQQIQASIMDLSNAGGAAAQIADRNVRYREEIVRLQEERSLVMQAFQEADHVLAPKVAQLLLLDWMEGDGYYPNAEHTALRFLHHDADTQGRIRDKVVNDLVRGRKLLPQVRSQMAANRNLLQAELVGAILNQTRSEESAIREKYRDSLRYAEAIADLLAPVPQFDNDFTLEIEPYLTVSEGGVDVVVNTKVRHDVYRALQVDVATTTDVVPYDDIESAIGRARYDDALAQTGLDEEDVLFAVTGATEVTSATPTPGYEDRAYTALPESQDFLFLVPGREEEPEDDTWIAADVAVHTCALGDEMPQDTLAEDTLEFCHDDDMPVTVWDRVAVYFTPARDFSDGTDIDKVFVWRIINPNGSRVASGSYFDAEAMGGAASTIMPEGSPGAFAARLPLRRAGASADPAEAYIGPGEYTIQTANANFANSGALFGTIDTTVSRDGEWVDEATFELQEVQLHYQGFVTEQFAERPMPPGDGIAFGKWTLGPVRDAGGNVTMDLSAYWYLMRGSSTYDPTVRRSSSTVRIGFPEVIDPAQDWTDFDVELVNNERGRGAAGSDYFFTTGMHFPVPSGESPPDRFLVDGPEPWEARDPEYKDGYIATTSGDGEWFRDQTSAPMYWTLQNAMDIAGTARLRKPDPWPHSGVPARTFSGHLHDPDATFVIPVFIHLTDSFRPPDAAYTAKTYGYAIYKAEAGSYTAPLPTDLPPAGPDMPDDLQPEDDNPGDTGGTGGGDTGGGDTGDNPPDPPDPPDPTGDDEPEDPPVTVPLPNVIGQPADAARATLEGAGFTASISIEAEATSEADQFTVQTQEPVGGTAVQEGASVSLGITGGFTPTRLTVPNVIGQAADTARGRLEGEGFVVELSIGSEPNSAGEQYTVSRQDPAPDSSVEEGATVSLTIYGEYIERVSVPAVVGQPATDAVAAMEALGLEVDLMVGDEAPSAPQARTVARQEPAAGAVVEAGTPVSLTMYGNYIATVPSVIGMDINTASNLINGAGLTPEVVETEGAPDQRSAFTVHWAIPGSGERVAPGTSVRLLAYGGWTDPAIALRERCDSLVTQANQLRGSGDLEGAMAVYQDALVQGCNNPGLDTVLDEVESEIAARDRNNMCDALVERGNQAFDRGDLQGALNAYQQARAQGCNNQGLDSSIADLQQALADPPPPPVRNDPPPPDVPESVTLESGYYVFELSGMGYKKSYRGVTRLYGSQIFYTRITGARIGMDSNDLIAQWTQDEADNRQWYCDRGPQLGPRDPAPHFWASGPNYALLAGPIPRQDVLDRYQCDANDGSWLLCHEWESEGGLPVEVLQPFCGSPVAGLRDDTVPELLRTTPLTYLLEDQR